MKIQTTVGAILAASLVTTPLMAEPVVRVETWVEFNHLAFDNVAGPVDLSDTDDLLGGIDAKAQIGGINGSASPSAFNPSPRRGTLPRPRRAALPLRPDARGL